LKSITFGGDVIDLERYYAHPTKSPLAQRYWTLAPPAPNARLVPCHYNNIETDILLRLLSPRLNVCYVSLFVVLGQHLI
jgi:hypothetical protein